MKSTFLSLCGSSVDLRASVLHTKVQMDLIPLIAVHTREEGVVRECAIGVKSGNCTRGKISDKQFVFCTVLG